MLCVVACEPLPGSDNTGASPGGASSGASGGGAGGVGVRRPINAEKLCSRLIDECKQPITRGECLRSFTAILVTGACADALATGSCTDLTTSSSPILDTCFPPCSGTLASCNGDGSITICTT